MTTLAATAPPRLLEAEGADVLLRMPASKRNVTLARAVVSALAAGVGAEEALIHDVRAAVSEAANNVVVHAYGDVTGPLVIEARVSEEGLSVTVHDEGRGIQPRAPAAGDVKGVGLDLIQALSDSVEFGAGAHDGTAVRMGFRASRPLRPMHAPAPARRAPQPSGPPGRLFLDVTPALIGPVLGDLSAALAARGGVSIERIGDVRVLADALAAHLPPALDEPRARIALGDAEAGIEITAGPLSLGGAADVVRASGVGGLPPLLAHLSSSIEAVPGDDHEWLRLMLART